MPAAVIAKRVALILSTEARAPSSPLEHSLLRRQHELKGNVRVAIDVGALAGIDSFLCAQEVFKETGI